MIFWTLYDGFFLLFLFVLIEIGSDILIPVLYQFQIDRVPSLIMGTGKENRDFLSLILAFAADSFVCFCDYGFFSVFSSESPVDQEVLTGETASSIEFDFFHSVFLCLIYVYYKERSLRLKDKIHGKFSWKSESTRLKPSRLQPSEYSKPGSYPKDLSYS